MAILMTQEGSIQPLILNAMLTTAGYVGEAQHQTAEVVQRIRFGAGLVPAIILLNGITLMSQLPFDHKREREIQADIKERHGVANPDS